VMARASQSASWALESTSEAKVRPGQERGLQEAVVALDHALGPSRQLHPMRRVGGLFG